LQKDPDLQTQSSFGEYTVQHVVFNSTFVLPDVARAYKLKRSKYESLLNISVFKKGLNGSLPAALSGTVTNLLQQQKSLEFIKIEEKDTTYYLAAIRINNEEKLHFNIDVTVDGHTETFNLRFSQTVYADE